MHTHIKYILTDLDGVIRYFPTERDHDIERSFHLPIGSISSTAFESTVLDRVIRGEISDSTWRELIVEKMQSIYPSADCQTAINVWSDFPGNVDLEVLRYLRELARERKLILLTNATSRLLMDLAQLGIKGQFDDIFNSSEIGHIKPEKEVFQFVMSTLKCEPHEIILIDDSESNVAAGRSLGIRSFHFRNLQSLKAEIAQASF